MRRKLKFASVSVLGFASMASAAAITPGDIVVYRVGDGSSALSTPTAAVFVDEYTTSGTLVQSIAMPTVPAATQLALTSSGNANSEGFLTQSQDGRFIALTGYNSPTATASATAQAGTKTIGLINIGSGAVDTSTGLTDAGTASPRSAFTIDGTTDYYAGGANGFRYTTTGTNGASTQLATSPTNNRVVKAFGGQLYGTTGSGTTRIGSIGTGEPTTSGQTFASFPGITSTNVVSGYSFYLADLSPTVAGYDTLYIADDAASTGGLQKYCLDNGTWVKYGVVDAATGTTGNLSYRGLDGLTLSNGTVDLYGTRSSSSASNVDNQLYAFADSSGYDQSISGEPTTLATAATNEVFRADAYVAAPEPMSLTLFGSGALLLISRRRRRVDTASDAI